MRYLLLGLNLLNASIVVAAQDLPKTVTFSEHIAPIINQHCLVCHRAEGVGPFSFETYEQVKRRTRQISEVATSRYMPPWKPDPRFTPLLSHERGLSEMEIALLNAWEEGGSPPGNLDHLPEPPRFPKEWALGEPDMILDFEEAYTLPAEGVDIYRNFVFRIPLAETRYVRAVEFLPESQQVIHHAVLYIDKTGTSWKLDKMEPGPGFSSMVLATADQPDGHFVGWTPGQRPFQAPTDTAWKWEPGSDLVLQLHLLPSGKPQRVAPKLGLHFAKAPPTRITSVISLREENINIPPGADNYEVRSSLELPVDVSALGVYPHAHYIGKDIKVYAELPNGDRQWLIRIPVWDFNWQMDYRFAEPVDLPQGTTVVMEYTYDNSAGNSRNPSTPPRRVKQGYRSIDEMAEATLQVEVKTEQDRDLLDRAVSDQLNLPDSQALAAFQIGWQFQETGDAEAAITAYQLALNSDPDFVPALAQLGMLEFEKGKAETGLKHFVKAYQADGESAENIWNLGNALFNLGYRKEASKLLSQLLEKEPERMGARLMLAVAFTESQSMDHSIQLLTEGMIWHEDDPLYRLQFGNIRMATGDASGAEMEYQYVLESNQSGYGLEKSRAAHSLAALSQRAGDRVKAKAFLDLAIQHDAHFAEAYVQLGTLCLMNGNTEEARKHFKTLVHLDEGDRPEPEQLIQVLPLPQGATLLVDAYMKAGMREAASSAVAETLKILRESNHREGMQEILKLKLHYRL